MTKLSVFFTLFLFQTLSFASHGHCKTEDDEVAVKQYELQKGNLKLGFTNYGATLNSVTFPDRHGKLADISLGFDNPEDYKNDTVYFGNIVGRVANRIGGAGFKLNGTYYKLPANDHNNTLHGGPKGFSDVIWKVTELVQTSKQAHITFSYDSFDGEEGFPGDLSVSVTYMILKHNILAIRMSATPLTKATPVNLAYHGYWNLGGHDSGTILNHTIHIISHYYTPVDDQLIPTGQFAVVKGTPYDFTTRSRQIGSRIDEVEGGYDINYVIARKIGPLEPHLEKTAVVRDEASGRKMELWTNQPGVQFYTGNMLDSVKGKGGVTYNKYAGLCLETQGFPDAVNHPNNFPSQVVEPGHTYVHAMVFRFTAT
ncbi:unnamed protein product [Linum trigynum]|uniref:Aldose 1-epimerase n=1 Tax=Linum trigynum TaxID=586398 RepID=A0AAV2D6S9_9ROSI